MLARVTYGLVGVAAITLILGFFVAKDSNVLLYVSIGLSIAAIILIVVGAARRAREAPEDLEAETFDEDGEEIPSDILAAFDEEELEPEYEDAYDEEFDEEEFEEEEVEETAPTPARRRPAATKTASKKKTAAKPASKKKAAAKPARSAAKTDNVIVVPGRDRYHTASCRFVKGKDDVEELSRTSAKRRGYEPCSVCSPDED